MRRCRAYVEILHPFISMVTFPCERNRSSTNKQTFEIFHFFIILSYTIAIHWFVIIKICSGRKVIQIMKYIPLCHHKYSILWFFSYYFSKWRSNIWRWSTVPTRQLVTLKDGVSTLSHIYIRGYFVIENAHQVLVYETVNGK